MKTMTVDQMKEKLEFFKNQSKSSIFSFLRSRGINSVGRGRKEVKNYGSAPKLFLVEDIIKAWEKKPIGQKTGTTGTTSRKYKKAYEKDDFECGERQPYRSIDCLNYIKCLDESWKTNVLNCTGCQRYQKKEFNYYETTN